MKPSQKLTLGRILVSKNKAIGDTRYTDRLGSTFTTVFFVIKRRITAICSAKGREREISSSVHEHVFSLRRMSSTPKWNVMVMWQGIVTLSEWLPLEKCFRSFNYLPNSISACVSDFGPGLQSLHWSAALSCTKFKLNPEFLSWTAMVLQKLLS